MAKNWQARALSQDPTTNKNQDPCFENAGSKSPPLLPLLSLSKGAIWKIKYCFSAYWLMICFVGFFLSFESKIEIPGAELWCSNIPCLLPCHRLKRPQLVSNHNLNVWRQKKKEQKCPKSSISVQKIEARPGLFIDCPLVFRCMWERTSSKVLSQKNLDHKVSVYFGRLHK